MPQAPWAQASALCLLVLASAPCCSEVFCFPLSSIRTPVLSAQSRGVFLAVQAV